MKERIIWIMKEKNMNASQFSDTVGIQKATISHILAGRNNPSLDIVTKILAKFPEISPDWLLSGKEPVMRSFSVNTGSAVPGGDLFSQSDFSLTAKSEMPPAPTEKPENNIGIREKKKFTDGVHPVDKVYNSENDGKEKEIAKETIVYKERPHKTIDKLLIFYSDNTFESFIPEKHNIKSDL
ncbi:MAG: helix-turn-helix domain-containing protein [Tannerella sp.]|jgi:DNA-binding XRE family transcriptional regulator|nr:helix-turn-helix domain-containing protein [Tannerella sp.]